MHDFSSASDGEFNSRRGKRRFDDDEPTTAKRVRRRRALPPIEKFDATDGLPEGDRWSTWDQSIPTERGPKPYPDWLVTELAAVDTEIGILKTGKEADALLLRRGVRRHEVLPAGRPALPVRRAPDVPPGQRLPGGPPDEGIQGQPGHVERQRIGRQAIAGQWAAAEFSVLCRCTWSACRS